MVAIRKIPTIFMPKLTLNESLGKFEEKKIPNVIFEQGFYLTIYILKSASSLVLGFSLPLDLSHIPTRKGGLPFCIYYDSKQEFSTKFQQQEYKSTDILQHICY